MACTSGELVTNDDGQLLADADGRLQVHNASSLECCGDAPLPCAICDPDATLKSVVVVLSGFTDCAYACYDSSVGGQCWDGDLIGGIFCPDQPRLGCPDVLPPSTACYPYATEGSLAYYRLRSINGALALPCTHRETNYCEFFRAVPYRRRVRWVSDAYNTVTEDPPELACPWDHVYDDETFDELTILVTLSLSSGTITMEVYVGTRDFGTGAEGNSNIGFVTSGMTVAKDDFCDGTSVSRSNQSAATRACPHPFVHGPNGTIVVMM